MNPISLLKLPFRYRPWHPAHWRLIAADIAGISRQPVLSDREHLEAAIDWLCRAQDNRNDQPDRGGVSAGWSFEDGWLPSYPETSGYIVETLLAATEPLGRPGLSERAGRILDWELSIQNPDGSYPGHFGETGSNPVIFNTGQIIHGMLAGYQHMGRPECLESAVRAAHWMRRQQDDDGCWRRSVHNGIPHTYNARAAWGQLRAALAANDRDIELSAIANLDWALTQQTDSGWYRNNAFTTTKPPFTHNIAYAIRGLLEAGMACGEERFVDSAIKAAKGLMAKQRADGGLAGTYSDAWEARAGYCCLTGLAQSAIIWKRLAQERDQAPMATAADQALEFLKRNHRITDPDPRVCGGIAGSAPIWGRYSMFEYPNWAAKFFADALMIHGKPPLIVPSAPQHHSPDIEASDAHA